MTAAPTSTEGDLLEQGLARLRVLLGPNLELDDYNIIAPQAPNLGSPLVDLGAERLITLRDPVGGTSSGPVLVEAKTTVSPAVLSRQLRPQVELMRRLNGDAAVLIISPWLSPRSRQVLEQLGYGYLDLTGNVSFRLMRPMTVLRLDGDKQDPSPRTKKVRAQMRGVKAGRLVRVLVDVAPPYRAADLALATRLSAPYVSRLLDAMEDQAFVERRGRLITDVDWQAILRARAASHELLRTNDAVPLIAGQGTQTVLDRLRSQQEEPGSSHWRLAVTGPFAAAAVAPIAVGGKLMIYFAFNSNKAMDKGGVEEVRRSLGLLHGETGSDVFLLEAEDPVVLVGVRRVDGVSHVSLSQLALDSLGGPGRMPAEGEEILANMAADEGWRLRDLDRWAMDAPLA